MRIPLTVDLATRMNRILPDGVKLEAGVGLVEITPAGRVIIGGRDMSAPTDAMCAALERDRAAAMRTPERGAQRRSGERPASASVPAAPKAEQPAVKAAPAPAVAKPEPVAAPKVEKKKEEKKVEEKPKPQVLKADPEPAVEAPAVEPAVEEVLMAPDMAEPELAPQPDVMPEAAPEIIMDDGFGDPATMTEPAHLLRDTAPEPVVEDEGLLPRPPMDVLSAPQAVPVPEAAPAPDDLLSGGE